MYHLCVLYKSSHIKALCWYVSFKAKFSHPQAYWYFWLDYSVCVGGGAVYCPESLRFLAASLASVHCIPVTLTSHLKMPHNNAKASWVGRGRQNLLSSWDHWPTLLLTRTPECCYPEMALLHYTRWLILDPTFVFFKYCFLWVEHIMVGSTMVPMIPAS